MIRNTSSLIKPAPTGSSTQGKNNLEELLLQLCTRITNVNNINEVYKESFVNRSFSDMIKAISSSTFADHFDEFEIAEKIKKKRMVI